MSLGERRTERERDVIGEDHSEAEHEASQPAVTPVGRAERKSDNTEHETRHRDRELPMDGHDLIVRRQSLSLEFRGTLLQFRNRHLGIAFLRTAAREGAFRTDADHLAIELDDLVRPIRIGHVARAVLEHHFDLPLHLIQNHAPMPHEVNRLRTAWRVVGHEDVVPPAFGRNVAHIEHEVGELVEEDAWLDLAFCALREHVVRDFAECLIRVRQRFEHHVGRRHPAENGNEGDRAEQPRNADAARLHRDEFTIRRQPAERDEQRNQERRGNRQRERRRKQRRHRAQHDRRRHAFGDERFGVLHHRRHD
jgi:hypothetical protein